MNEKMPEQRINPDIKRVEVGIETMRTVTVYPLSAGFNVKLAKGISDLLVDFFSTKAIKMSDDEINQKVASLFVSLVQDNLYVIVEQAVRLDKAGYDSVEQFMEDCSTSQFERIVEIVYEVNYKGIAGKVAGFLQTEGETMQGLTLGTMGKASPLKESSPSSAEATEPTN